MATFSQLSAEHSKTINDNVNCSFVNHDVVISLETKVRGTRLFANKIQEPFCPHYLSSNFFTFDGPGTCSLLRDTCPNYKLIKTFENVRPYGQDYQ